MGILQHSIEGLLYSLYSLTVPLKELEKKKQVVSHALSNKDNAGIVFQMEGLPDSFQGLQDLLVSLSVQVEEMENKKNGVLHALLSKDNAISKKEPTVRDIIIVFVEEIEKAHQYYEFLLFLNQHDLVKSDDDAVEILQYLIQERKVHELSQFNKLDFKQILDAVEVCIRDRKIKQHRDGLIMQGHTTYEAFPETENDWYSLVSAKVQEKQVGRRENPILGLVYYIREKVCFVCRLLWKLSEKEVLVPFVPPDFPEDDIEAELSLCGKIESFKMRSPEPGCRTKSAYVTFEDSVAAKIAPLLMIRPFITPVHEEYEYQPKDITEYDKASIKYKEFRNYFRKMSN